MAVATGTWRALAGWTGVWVPGAFAPETGTTWPAQSSESIAAVVDTDGHAVRLEHRIDRDGRLVASSFPRWGDPDRTGTWHEHRFGVEVGSHRQFDAVNIPAESEAGWRRRSNTTPS